MPSLLQVLSGLQLLRLHHSHCDLPRLQHRLSTQILRSISRYASLHLLLQISGKKEGFEVMVQLTFDVVFLVPFSFPFHKFYPFIPVDHPLMIVVCIFQPFSPILRTVVCSRLSGSLLSPDAVEVSRRYKRVEDRPRKGHHGCSLAFMYDILVGLSPPSPSKHPCVRLPSKLMPVIITSSKLAALVCKVGIVDM
jgi:hypothetical protein